MTEQPKDGGPAFPVVRLAYVEDPGMSLRDWFAGQAEPLPGDTCDEYGEALIGEPSPPHADRLACARYWARVDAVYRYIFADAMLEARRK